MLYPYNLCLSVVQESLALVKCNPQDPYQLWEFGAYTLDYLNAQSGHLPLGSSQTREYQLALQKWLARHKVFDVEPQTVKTWWRQKLEELNRRRALTGALNTQLQHLRNTEQELSSL